MLSSSVGGLLGQLHTEGVVKSGVVGFAGVGWGWGKKRGGFGAQSNFVPFTSHLQLVNQFWGSWLPFNTLRSCLLKELLMHFTKRRLL